MKIRTINKEEHGIRYLPDAPYEFGKYDLSQFGRDDIIKAFDRQALKNAEERGFVAAYPKTEPDDEGYKWFMSNRVTHSISRKKGEGDSGKRDSGARNRWQVAYNQYMVPLQPVLSDNPVLKEHSTLRKVKSSEHYEIGMTLDGIVVDYKENKTGRLVYTVVKAGEKRINIHISSFRPKIFGDIRKEVPKGTHVEIRYCGKNDFNKDNWECKMVLQ